MPNPYRRLLMLKAAVALGALAGAGLLDAGGAAMAQYRRPAPWCAYLGGRDGGYDCAYYNFEQCMETARGLGNTCARNPYALHAPDQRARRSRQW